MPARVLRSVELACDADAAWALIQDPDTLRHVTKGLLGIEGELPETFGEGDTLKLRLKLFGVLPANEHTIRLVSIDHERRELRTEEHGGALRSWNHRITVEPAGPGRCRYTDDVVLDAGPATPVARVVADGFYAYRQRRLRDLASRSRTAAS